MNGLHVAATARVTSEPELKYTQGGKALLVFNAMADQSYTATSERAAPPPIWLRVTAWEATAEGLADVLQKGDSVYLEGKLTHQQWEGAAGTARCGLSVSAWTVEQHGRLGKHAPRREPTAAGRTA